MRVALIGYGYWGRILRRYLDADPRIRLARICSRDIQPDGLYTDDLEEVLLDEGIEALFICTPIDTHFAICERGLMAGKHIFCEKPTTKGWGQFQVLEQLAAENGGVLYTDYIYTVSPSIQKMRELLGRCGKIRLVRGGIGQFGAFYPGDSIYEVIGVHLFSILPYLFGDVAVTGCRVDGLYGDHTVHGDVSMELAGKLRVELRLDLLQPKKVRTFSVYGTEGSILFDMMDEVTLRFCGYRKVGAGYVVGERQEWRFDERDNLRYVVDDFLGCIEAGEDGQNRMIAEWVDAVLGKIWNKDGS